MFKLRSKMAGKDHKHSMSQTERKLWVDVVLRLLETRHVIADSDVNQIAQLADRFVNEYRVRVTWRNT